MIRLRSLIILFAAFASAGYAATPETYDPFELDLEKNINTPAVPQKQQQTVKEHISRLKSALEQSGFRPSRVRQGEALMITIPCDRMFRANMTTLSPQGMQLLRKLVLPSDAAGKYKILIAVHTDNTGEVAYADSITAARANAIDDYLSASGKLTDITIVPYGLGRDEPLVGNDSVKKRAQNRRVEIYIIPEETLFSKRKSSK